MVETVQTSQAEPVGLMAEYVEGNFGRGVGEDTLEGNLNLQDLRLEIREPVGSVEPLESRYHKLNHIFVEYDDLGKPENVIKIYPETRVNTRDKDWFWESQNPVRNSARASQENPQLFPESEEIGRGLLYTDLGKYKMGVLRQGYIPGAEENTLRRSLEENGYVREVMKDALNRWDLLVGGHRTGLSKRDRKLKEMADAGDERAQQEVRKTYYQEFPSLLAGLVSEGLEERGIEVEFKDVEIKKSKTVGDPAPRQVLVGEECPYLSFDLDRYGYGEPEKDLSFLVEMIRRKEGSEMALRAGEEILSLYDGPETELFEKLKRSDLTYRGEKYLFGPESKRERNLRLLEEEIEFYESLSPR